MADYLGIQLEELETLNEKSRLLIGFVLRASKWVNDTKKNYLARLISGTVIDFKVNGKNIKIFSNAGMRDLFGKDMKNKMSMKLLSL